MTELNATDTVLTWMLTWGAPAFGLALLACGLGAPLPATLLVLAGGAFVQQGILDAASVAAYGLVGVVAGDNGSFAVGRLAHNQARRRFGRTAAWRSARALVARRGGLAVFLTRFWLTPLALPTNLVAGASGFSYARFLACDVAGELMWIGLFGGIGYALGGQWEDIAGLVSDFNGLAIGVLALGVGIAALRRRR